MSSAPEVRVQDAPEAMRFEARLAEKESSGVAVAEYHLKNDVIIFTHTEVPEDMEGQGVGSALIREALETSRERNYSVVPLCPFVASYIRQHEAYRDLVPDRFKYMVT